MADESLRDYLDYAYKVEVEKKEGEFYLFIPDLNLVVISENLSEGYSQLEDNKEVLIRRHYDVGRLNALSPPRNMVEKSFLMKKLTPFLIKAGVVAVVGGLLVAVANVSLIYTLQSAPKKLAQRAARGAVSNFAESFERFHDKEMSPEKEARIREAIRQAVPKLRPYARELRPLFEEALGESAQR
jgi:hypothetical protein